VIVVAFTTQHATEECEPLAIVEGTGVERWSERAAEIHGLHALILPGTTLLTETAPDV
jgi:hypothetical protein